MMYNHFFNSLSSIRKKNQKLNEILLENSSLACLSVLVGIVKREKKLFSVNQMQKTNNNKIHREEKKIENERRRHQRATEC